MAEIVRHKKTGGLYEVLFRGAQIQTNEPLGDYDKVAVYQRQGGGPVWVRPTSEMDDGRFEPADAVEAPASTDQVPSPAPARQEEGSRGDGPGLTLRALHTANIARQAEWCPDQVPDLSFRGNELAGEVGEACNVVKKLERERHGWRGSRATLDDLAQELADVVICADLCAITAGIDLDAAVVAKFNATSEKQGLRTTLPAPTPDANSGGEAPGRDSPLAYETDERGAWTWVVWAIQPTGPQLAAIAATEARAEAYRDVVAQTYPRARFFAERAPVNHVFGASDLRSVAGRAAVRSSRQGYAAPHPSQDTGGADA